METDGKVMRRVSICIVKCKHVFLCLRDAEGSHANVIGHHLISKKIRHFSKTIYIKGLRLLFSEKGRRTANESPFGKIKM